ncbi:MAG: SMP-30/gluconolactonase/LRE family protein, partial [Pseudomonadota bacterium]|nr:SMP-30/gluconolactonase/LRE family protein [Pseudomonadota bacterium]
VLLAVNFVRLDPLNRIWVCANPPLSDDDRYPTEEAEGFVAVVDSSGARIVADGIGWANECLVHPSGRHLFVNETFGRRLSRFDIGSDAALSNRTAVTEFGHGTYPDGIALDEEEALWVVSVASNRVIRVTPDGRQNIVLEDSVASHLDRLEKAYHEHRLTRPELTRPLDTTLKNISSIAFGGHDRRTIYLGSIGGDRLATFRSPIAGAPPVHWAW